MCASAVQERTACSRPAVAYVRAVVVGREAGVILRTRCEARVRRRVTNDACRAAAANPWQHLLLGARGEWKEEAHEQGLPPARSALQRLGGFAHVS